MLNQITANALTLTLDDEYRAHATYRAVLDKFGPAPPFVNIIEAEERHIQALLSLFYAYGLIPPVDRWAGQVLVPDALLECCLAGVEAEVQNYSLYDGLLPSIQELDICLVFTKLRNASEFNHLPAFQRCVERLQAISSPTIPSDAGKTFPQERVFPTAGNPSFWILAGSLAGAAMVYYMKRQALHRDA